MNDHRARAARAYLEARVQSASPAELIGLLYEGLVKELRLGAVSMQRGELVARGVAIGQAVGILAELRANLNHESGGEVATNLERLYAYWTRRITEAHARSERGPLDEIIPQIESLRGAWNEGVVRGVAGEAGAVSAETAATAAKVQRPGPSQPSPGEQAVRREGPGSAVRPSVASPSETEDRVAGTTAPGQPRPASVAPAAYAAVLASGSGRSR